MWKHIILCFYKENNCKVLTLNNIISYVSYRIYRFKMLCTFKKKNENCQSLREYVRKSLITNINYLIMYLKSSKYIIKLKCLANILLILLYTRCTYGLPTCMCATLGDHVMGCMQMCLSTGLARVLHVHVLTYLFIANTALLRHFTFLFDRRFKITFFP